MTREITLTRGKVAVVDDEWFEYLNQWKWSAIRYSQKYPDQFYAGRYLKDGSVVWMHRVINQTPDGMMTDHIDRDTLHNVSANLRSATHSNNVHNRKKQRHNTSGYIGVTRSGRKWVARIATNGERLNLGTFEDPITAARMYDTFAIKYHGEFAKTNF